MARNRTHEHVHTTLVTYFPMFIATLSVVSSIYQAVLFTRSLDIVQRNVSRGEYLRTCREIIDTYFQIKLVVAQGAQGRVEIVQAQNLVSKFGALGTYLANFQDEEIRVRYTGLSHELSRLVSAPREDADFEKADGLFAQMNEDCVRLAQVVRM